MSFWFKPPLARMQGYLHDRLNTSLMTTDSILSSVYTAPVLFIDEFVLYYVIPTWY